MLRSRSSKAYVAILGWALLLGRALPGLAGDGDGRSLGGGQRVVGCLPSCSEVDGRFLAISSGPRLGSLSRSVQNLQIVVQQGRGSFAMGIFDGDCGAQDGAGDLHWDRGVASFEMSVYADPTQDGVSTFRVLGPILSTDLASNAWSDFDIPRVPEARTLRGVLAYRVELRALDPTLTTVNAFKIRTEGNLSIRQDQQPFGFYASITGLADALIIFPSFPDLGPTTYDGSFDLPFVLSRPQERIEIWDGDFDFGSFDNSDQDTDDETTPPAPFLPAWATPMAMPEMAAPGRPPDDNEAEGIVRSPAIRYLLTTPDGDTFANDNPSGNLEWESFVVAVGRFDSRFTDVEASRLSGGTYRLQVVGADMQNMGFLRLPGDLLCLTPAGAACTPIRPSV